MPRAPSEGGQPPRVPSCLRPGVPLGLLGLGSPLDPLCLPMRLKGVPAPWGSLLLSAVEGGAVFRGSALQAWVLRRASGGSALVGFLRKGGSDWLAVTRLLGFRGAAPGAGSCLARGRSGREVRTGPRGSQPWPAQPGRRHSRNQQGPELRPPEADSGLCGSGGGFSCPLTFVSAVLKARGLFRSYSRLGGEGGPAPWGGPALLPRLCV